MSPIYMTPMHILISQTAKRRSVKSTTQFGAKLVKFTQICRQTLP